MRRSSTGNLTSAINVTPLVDVVLVLLIIFMVIAPQIASGPSVPVPVTDNPAVGQDAEDRLLVTLAPGGLYWIDEALVDANGFEQSINLRAIDQPESKVLIQADASMHFGDVKSVMRAVEAAGFKSVGLVAKTRTEPGE